jgi:hypothetical protein
MIVAILYRLAGSPADSGPSSFTDVPAGQYYTSAVDWAAANGIVEGIGGGRFSPDGSITRQDLAVIIYRYEQFIDKIPASIVSDREFSDGDSISDYAKGAVNILAIQGIISGKPASSIVSGSENQLSPQGSNLFDPAGTATRAEVAAILHRFMEAVNKI